MKVINKLLVSVAWIAIIGLSLYFFFDNVVAYLYGFRSKIFGDTFFNNQFWVVAHLVGGSISLFTGPIQFWKTLRLKYNSFHKVVGKIYIAAAFITGLSGTPSFIYKPLYSMQNIVVSSLAVHAVVDSVRIIGYKKTKDPVTSAVYDSKLCVDSFFRCRATRPVDPAHLFV